MLSHLCLRSASREGLVSRPILHSIRDNTISHERAVLMNEAFRHFSVVVYEERGLALLLDYLRLHTKAVLACRFNVASRAWTARGRTFV